MPRNIGGDLATGVDEHCCSGVENQPLLSDVEGICRRYLQEKINYSATSSFTSSTYSGNVFGSALDNEPKYDRVKGP